MCYFDCFIAWNYGFVLCSTGKRQLLDDLEETIKSMDITMLFLTPAIASTLCIENHPRIDFLSCAGEAMTQSLVSDWEGRCVNSYGPTGICAYILIVEELAQLIFIRGYYDLHNVPSEQQSEMHQHWEPTSHIFFPCFFKYFFICAT